MAFTTSYIYRQIMFYLMIFFCAVSSSQSEFPCTFPCDWINKTFGLYSPSFLTNLTFNADGTTGKLFSEDTQCFQISEQFLIIRGDDAVPNFVWSIYCFPIFYTSGQSNFTMDYKGKRTVFPQSGAFSDSQLCEICKPQPSSSSTTVLALEQPSTAPNEVPPVPCEAPSHCESDTRTICPQGGSIQKECFNKDTTTTETPITTSLAQSTTTTAGDTTTSTRPKKPCRRGRFHRHGQ